MVKAQRSEGRRTLDFKEEIEENMNAGVGDSRLNNIYEYTLKSYKMNDSESRQSNSNTH